MLLLYRYLMPSPPYAAANLHSIMLLLYLLPSWSCPGSAASTFHYASTLSDYASCCGVPTPDLHSIMLLLYPDSWLIKPGTPISTFHYASTLSRLYYNSLVIGTNLHSIMLLLYRSYREWQRPGTLIYIPLCFYFIGDYGTCKPDCDKPSTFHYASTLSEVNGISNYTGSYLHSIMLLLYRMRPPRELRAPCN